MAIVTRPNPVAVAKSSPALRVTRFPLRAGDAGIARTVHWMRGLVLGREGVGNATIRATALDIVRGTPARDDLAQMNAILVWVKRNIEFRGEYAETIQSPLATLQLKAGDCDDHATLVAALLASLGIRARFQTVAAAASAPGEFSHVFTEGLDRKSGQWVAIDSTVAGSTLGWRPERITRAQAWTPMGNLGDPTQQQTTPQNWKQVTYGIAEPLAIAWANRLMYGKQEQRVGFDVGRAPSGQYYSGGVGLSGVSSTALVVGGVSVAAIVLMMMLRRS